MKEEGLRYNKGKRRVDLVPPSLIEGVADVLDFGARKYDDNNWRKGMKWSSVMASLKRHLLAFEKGEDYDPESGLLHIDHVGCNVAFLKEYYKIAPHFDDRLKPYLSRPKIGLDIDEVICDWVGAWIKKFDLHVPTAWFFDYQIPERFDILREAGELDEFYMRLEPKLAPEDIPFEPHAYVTSRPVSTEVTIEWLKKHKFPTRPVITVPVGTSKVDVIKESGIEVFVDDRFENFLDLNKAGICTYLFDAPHNQRYDVGYRRIKSLKELM